MARKRAKRVLYPVLLVTAWCLMVYSVFLGGFSTSLAFYDYTGGGGAGGWDCPYPSGCGSFGCQVAFGGQSATCSTYAVIPGRSCPSPLQCRKLP